MLRPSHVYGFIVAIKFLDVLLLVETKNGAKDNPCCYDKILNISLLRKIRTTTRDADFGNFEHVQSFLFMHHVDWKYCTCTIIFVLFHSSLVAIDTCAMLSCLLTLFSVSYLK